MRHVKGFPSFAQKENPSLVARYCFVGREDPLLKSTDGNGLGQVIRTTINKNNIKMVH
jgi:hypothetical protein